MASTQEEINETPETIEIVSDNENENVPVPEIVKDPAPKVPRINVGSYGKIVSINKCLTSYHQ
jgi:hypothetical protein